MELHTFAPGTSPEDAQAMTMAALQVISGGWPALYFKAPSIEGMPVTLDQDAMIRDAVKLAIQVQDKALESCPKGSVDIVSRLAEYAHHDPGCRAESYLDECTCGFRECAVSLGLSVR